MYKVFCDTDTALPVSVLSMTIAIFFRLAEATASRQGNKMSSKKKWEELMSRNEELEPQLQIVEETISPELSDNDRYMMSIGIDIVRSLFQMTRSSDSKEYLN